MIDQHSRHLATEHVESVSQFVGRQPELKLIWNQYKAAKSGRVRVVLLAGELGIGKTRLLDEIATRAAQDGAVLLHGEASQSEGMPPYLPFLEALGQHIRVTPPEELRKQIAVAPQALVSILPELSAYLGDVPETYLLPHEQARLRLYEAVTAFLEVISMPHGLVLTLDDLHWADSASLDLLSYIPRHLPGARLLILGTYREGEVNLNPILERTLTELARQRVLTKVTVGPLSSEEIEALAISFLGAAISPTVSQLLYTHSEGNPFFAEELLCDWVEKSALVQEDNRWVTAGPLDQALPPSIVGALRQRFARLRTGIIDHLRIAAIIGRTFDLSLLASLEDEEFEVVEEALLEAERARLVRVEQEGLFMFSHDKIRETLYAEVRTSRRRRLHETIGRLLEARYDQNKQKSTSQLAELAFHFTHGGDRMRGSVYSQLAAEQALKSLAIEEAMSHYRRALELLDPDDRRRGNLLLGLGEAAFLADAEIVAADAYKGAFAWFSQAGELETAAQAAHKLGLVHWRMEALQDARVAFERSLGLLEDSSSTELVQVLVDLATLLTNWMGQQAEGVAYAERALEMARRLGIASLEAAATWAIDGTLFTPGKDISNALQAAEQALELAEDIDYPSKASEWCLYLAEAYYCTSEIGRSFEMSLRRMELIERYRDAYDLRNTYTWLALLHASQGAWVEAEQTIEEALTTASHLPGQAPLSFLSLIRGFLAYQKEDFVTAERELQVIRANRQQSPYWSKFYTGLLGMIQVARGNRAKAYVCVSELEGILDELPAGTLLAAFIIVCLALIALASGDQKRVADLYPRLLDFRGQHYWFLVDRVLGVAASIRGDWEAAAMHLTAAEAKARREGLRPELARVLLSWTDYELGRGVQGYIARAENHLKQALKLYEEMDMTDAAERVLSRLQTLSQRQHGSSAQSLPADLTEREAEVLLLVARGRRNSQIAQELGLSAKTVANHLTHIFTKTGSENRAAATAFAIHHSLARLVRAPLSK